MRLVLLLLVALITLITLISLAEAGDKDEYEDWWPRPGIQENLLVHLINIKHNCSLKLTNETYPAEYPSGRGSSQQLVLGCEPLTRDTREENLDTPPFLWEVLRSIGGKASEKVDWNFDTKPVIENNTVVQLNNFKFSTNLNSHNVAAPVSSTKYEITGYVKYRRGLEPENDWELVLADTETLWWENITMRLRHVNTGKFLSVTEHLLPDTWGQGMREVVGSSSNKASYWRVAFSRRPRAVEVMGKVQELEIYHNGTTETTTGGKDVINNTQSSIADLLLLHDRETQLLEMLHSDEKIFNVIKEEFSSDEFDLESVKDSDILHPVDSYNLIKRTARTWKRIGQKLNIENEQLRITVLETIKSFPNWDTSRFAVALGLLNIHKYYELEPLDLVNGILHDNFKNVTYYAKTRLGVGDAKLLAEVALDDEVENLVGAVQWLKIFPKLRKRYMKLAIRHDDLINYDPKEALAKNILTAAVPFEQTVFEKTDIKRLNDLEKSRCPPFTGENLSNCVGRCLEYNRASDIAKLCQGDRSLRPPEKDMDVKCQHLHYKDPFLRLLPFRLEEANTEGNYVAVIHGLMTEQEVERMKDKAKGHMKATPYSVGGENQAFSYKRSSKIKYVSERNDQLARTVTSRLEKALAFKIFTPEYRFSSENYQLMNYGFGGLISLHLDSSSGHETFDNDIGGGRFTTAMIYLSHLASGGFTVFPKLGLFFEPRAGDLLFWNLKRTDGSTDERMQHLGCPVLYGDKWILNKWVRWSSQMFTFDCFLPKGINYPSNLDVRTKM